MNQEHAWKWIVASAAILTIGGTIGVAMMLNTPSTTSKAVVATKTPTETTPTTTTPSTETPTKRTNAPFVITTMTHMEGNFKDDVDQNLFKKHVADMRWAMDLFDEYGAKLTFESEQSFAKANTTWGLNIMKEVVDRGHGVGTHADFGATKDATLADDIASFTANKALVDALVGAENNQGVSGGTGPADWVTAAKTAGFKYIDAVTGFGYLSMPLTARPTGWTNDYIVHTAYHDSIPPNLIDRIYPIPLDNANDLVADPGASLTVMSGDIGELSSIAEGRSTCNPDCVFDQNDVDAVIAAIKEADTARDTSRFAKINFHIPLSLLVKSNETLLRSMLSAIKKYTDDGTLSWDTMLGSYKQYVQWGE